MSESQDKRPGQRYKTIRAWLGLTLQDVEVASSRIAEKLADLRYAITSSTLADLENHDRIPGIYKLFSLAVIYQLPVREALQLVGIDAYKQEDYSDCGLDPRLTRPVDFTGGQSVLDMPIRFDPAFSSQTSVLLNRAIQEWQPVPLEFFKEMNFDKFLFARIGEKNNYLHPLLPTGAIVKVDPRLTQVINWGWRHEFERPIYLVASHQGYFCCWCQQEKRDLILVPHPLSQCSYLRLLLGQEAEVMGQSVGVWMPLNPVLSQPGPP